jgi:hypothetical protein
MSDIKGIDQKIADLLRKKDRLRQKAALTLYRKLEGIMGEEFSPQMVLGLMAEQWRQATPLQQQKWRKEGEVLFRTTTAQSTARNQAASQPLTTT